MTLLSLPAFVAGGSAGGPCGAVTIGVKSWMFTRLVDPQRGQNLAVDFRI